MRRFAPLDRIFVDATVLFSAAYRPNAGLLAFWKLPHVTLCSSRYALEEARLNLTEAAQMRRLASLARKLRFDAISPEQPPALSLPEKDWPILAAALQARATHLVSGDRRHFGPHFGKRIGGILILTPAEYLNSRG